jgi:hypothetical protein
MKKNSQFRICLLLIVLLSLMAGLSSGCAPRLSREMLTPSPTITDTPLPSRTPDPSKPTKTPLPTSRPRKASPTPAKEAQPTRTMRVSNIPARGLQVKEYYLGQAEGYDLQPGSYEQNREFYENIPQEILAGRNALRVQPAPPSVEQVNAALQPFDFRLEPSATQKNQYRFYRGNELLFDHVTAYGAVSLNSSNSDFLFSITLGNYEVWVIQKDRFEMWYAGEPRYLPIFAGDNLVAIGEPGDYVEAGQAVFGVPILVNDQPKYYLALPYQGANNCPIEKFRAWDDHWVLEMEGEVLVDGEKLTQKYLYEQVFNWQLINGEEFFLFKEAGYYGMFYNGGDLSISYGEIVHWPCIDQQGGGGVNLSAASSDQIVTFFARRGMAWYYVEVESAQ